MAELLRNPEKLSKAQEELKQVIGKGKSVQESDITRLPYLQAGAQVLANAWAIGRDPNIWDNPTSFIPERWSCAEKMNMEEKFGITLQMAHPLIAVPIKY
ncbi:hypothetical protein L3X38_004890 [Prunus dulcis]|uniref:Uncharacterized protein n=1 Tax=Prunus dulcis TaxID=3755 RepID=A0AAD4ZPW9_PRUDU|nr:hypothetical protein L3X38_004890 [Prunus dulcis]